jgi:hypothetical protein
MPVFHDTHTKTTVAKQAIGELHDALQALSDTAMAMDDFEQFEREVHALFVCAQRDVLASELAQLDVDLPDVLIDGVKHSRVLRSRGTYTSAVGPIRVIRTLYRHQRHKSVVPMELRAGIVDGHWSPLAAKQGAWTVAHLTPQDGEALFAQLGNMQPSKSSLDRLPKQLSTHWEAQREAFEASLRAQQTVPEQAVTLSVSLDGVMVPMKDGERLAKRMHAKNNGRRLRGPAGYQEVGCGTLSFHDADGERLSTIRLARMPEANKATLKSQLSAEIAAVLAQRPQLKLVKVADGAKDNWTYLSHTLPAGTELVDYFHAVQHLKQAFDAAYGEHTAKADAQFHKYRHILRDEHEGIDKVIRALRHLRRKHPRRKALKTQLAYFRGHRARMQYATAKEQNLPIGSGIIEAACKTLATQRLKRSGMRWRHPGGQAILTLRALIQSDRFERAWSLLSNTYKKTVTWPHNVIPIGCQRAA